MFKFFPAVCILFVFIIGNGGLAQNTGGDKGRKLGDGSVRFRKHRLRRSNQPPDPLISSKSPGRNKHPRRHRRHRKLRH